jgi:transposase
LRSKDVQRASMWTTLSPEDAVPPDHPLRPIRTMVNTILSDLSPEFSKIYAKRGRPSIPPEKLLRALLLQIFFSIRSEPMLLEQLRYNLLFRWFVGLGMDDPIWDVSSFSKNRSRFLDGAISAKFFAAVVAKARGANLLSDEHFTVDGTLIEAWASYKSIKPKDGDDGRTGGARNREVDFRGTSRHYDTHVSATDRDARMFKKSRGARVMLGYLGHVLMENRNGLVVNTRVTHATGTAEREAALEMLSEQRRSKVTLGADKGYDAAQFVEALRALDVTPHIAQNDIRRRSAIDARTTRHQGYDISQRKRKRVEEIFGWGKVVGPVRKVHIRGLSLVGDLFCWTASAFNLLRMRNLGVT